MTLSVRERAKLSAARKYLKDEEAKLGSPPPADRVIHLPGLELPGGFGLRIRGPSRRWHMRYRFGADQVRWSRDAELFSLDEAFIQARAVARQLEADEDPRVVAPPPAPPAPTVADLAAIFKEEHLPKKRPATQRDYLAIIDRDVLPALGHLKVADVAPSDVDALHRRVTSRGALYRANRAVAVVSKMFSMAIRRQWRIDNPAKGVERNQELKRQRFLQGDELARLTGALRAYEDRQAAKIILLLLLTGARRGEVLAARWDQFTDEGLWVKPGSTTKQKTEHRVHLSSPARELIARLRTEAEKDAVYLFPGRSGGHRAEIRGDWAAICKAAGLAETRIHDLRHTYASILAGEGVSLPIIGALLGHTQPSTTARYAHLGADPQLAATERAGAVIAVRP